MFEKILTFIASIVIYIMGPSHLGTSDCGIEKTFVAEQKLHLQGHISGSGTKFIKYKVEKSGDKIFIAIYGRYITDFDTITSGRIDIWQDIPDDINAIYLRGDTGDDLKLLWRR